MCYAEHQSNKDFTFRVLRAFTENVSVLPGVYNYNIRVGKSRTNRLQTEIKTNTSEKKYKTRFCFIYMSDI